MTEVYEKWRTDSDIFDVLSRFGLDALDPDLQLLLEKAVNNPRDCYLSRKKLGEALDQKCIPLPSIRLIASVVESKDWSTVGHGVDPQVALGSGHYKGLSHP